MINKAITIAIRIQLLVSYIISIILYAFIMGACATTLSTLLSYMHPVSEASFMFHLGKAKDNMTSFYLHSGLRSTIDDI